MSLYLNPLEALPDGRILEYVDACLAAYQRPAPLPEIPHRADPASVAAARMRRAEVMQANRAALAALLWASRALMGVPDGGDRKESVAVALWEGWSYRAAIPPDLTSCRVVAARWGTADWPSIAHGDDDHG